jgi:hypothetical protein
LSEFFDAGKHIKTRKETNNMTLREKIKKILVVSYYEDYIDHLDDDLYLEDLLNLSREIIADEGKVILEIIYVNAPPDIVKVISTIKEVDEWQYKIKEMKERKKKATP